MCPMAYSSDFDTYIPASRGTSVGKTLVKDMRGGGIKVDKAPNTFPKFPGKNEELDHEGFLAFLESDLGGDVLRGMAQSDEQYRFI